MTISQDIQTRLDEIRPIYDAIQQMRAEWQALQGVEQANAEYASLVAEEDKILETLEQRKQGLEAEKRKLTLLRETVQERLRPRPSPAPRQFPIRPPQSHSLALHTNREVGLAARSQLKKMVNRWAYSWQLKPAIQSQINRIADDLDRPLGEALVLLDWSVYEDRKRTRENEAAHLARLIEWDQALVEYRDQLAGEIDTLKTRFRRVLSIWELWRARESAEGQRRWDIHITEARQAKQTEIARLKADITRLETELADLKARVASREGNHV
jgi:hypothetical protein